MNRSPLAPKTFAELPPIAGVDLAVAGSGMKYQGRNDMVLITTGSDSAIAGVFTQSDTAAAPVQWCQSKLASGFTSTSNIAIFTNAGNANAFTGAQGLVDVGVICGNLGARMDIDPDNILIASTGVIGEFLDTDCLIARFDDLLNSDKNTDTNWQAAADAIRTTDTFAKGAAASARLGETTIQISGIAKGSGMIAPNMATMLGYVATDAAIAPELLATLLQDSNRRSFNAITVDGDTSTNDSVFLIATGKAGNPIIDHPSHPDLPAFIAALDSVMQDLAKQIVRDGEGASKFITIDITGAKNNDQAHEIGLAIANSPLVKTAIAGEDANWGRIVMAVGKAGLGINQDDISIAIGGVHITENGACRADYDETPVAAHMKNAEIDVAVAIGDGDGLARIWTCDLTHGYISINADYRS